MHRTQRTLWILVGAAAGALVAMLAVYLFGDTDVNVASVSAGAFALAGLLLGARLSRNSDHENGFAKSDWNVLGSLLRQRTF